MKRRKAVSSRAEFPLGLTLHSWWYKACLVWEFRSRAIAVTALFSCLARSSSREPASADWSSTREAHPHPSHLTSPLRWRPHHPPRTRRAICAPLSWGLGIRPSCFWIAPFRFGLICSMSTSAKGTNLLVDLLWKQLFHYAVVSFVL